MIRPAQTARSERTRAALRRAAVLRFLTQGVEDTTAEQIASDAGVTLRTFYRHFNSKHELLFADYDAGLHWFRRALAARPDDEPIIESVRMAIFAFPYDVEAVTQIAALRAHALDPGRIVAHMRQVEADFALAVAERLGARAGVEPGTSLALTVTGRCIAAAVFGAMEFWMLGSDRSLAELARLSNAALSAIEDGPIGGVVRQY
jgi:AcrR family transcriptional regulator